MTSSVTTAKGHADDASFFCLSLSLCLRCSAQRELRQRARIEGRREPSSSSSAGARAGHIEKNSRPEQTKGTFPPFSTRREGRKIKNLFGLGISEGSRESPRAELRFFFSSSGREGKKERNATLATPRSLLLEQEEEEKVRKRERKRKKYCFPTLLQHHPSDESYESKTHAERGRESRER